MYLRSVKKMMLILETVELSGHYQIKKQKELYISTILQLAILLAWSLTILKSTIKLNK
jgi:hypothetical protein